MYYQHLKEALHCSSQFSLLQMPPPPCICWLIAQWQSAGVGRACWPHCPPPCNSLGICSVQPRGEMSTCISLPCDQQHSESSSPSPCSESMYEACMSMQGLCDFSWQNMLCEVLRSGSFCQNWLRVLLYQEPKWVRHAYALPESRDSRKPIPVVLISLL